jgi:hypothetical protein
MADNAHSRGSRSDSHGRDGAGASSPSTDPLIELARLIGQNTSLAAGSGRERRPDSRPPEATPAHDQDKNAPSYDRYGVAPELGHADDDGHEAHDGHPSDEHAPDGHYDQGYDAHFQDRDEAHAHSGTSGYEESFRGHGEGRESPYFGADEHGHAQEQEDEFSGDERTPRRRGGLIAVAALVGLAVIGTAGAFAYRTVFRGATSAPPVIIRADAGPNKIVPAAQNTDTAASKQIYDRMGDVGQNERVVSREEQPINIPDPARAGSPRTAAPGPGAPFVTLPGGAPAQPGLPDAAAIAQPPQPGGEPRKIRTVTIKADQPSSDAARAAAPARTAAQQPAVTPRASAPASPNAPLTLVPPDAANPPAARPTAPRPHVAAVPRPEATPAPRPQAANASEGAGYYVQVSAQKTEAEAQASFRNIQAKYASVLSGRQPVIRRKDLGSKGIFYGAQVGPLSREDAVHLCDSLKSAGGSCMLQRN